MAAKQETLTVTAPSHLNFLSLPPPPLHAPCLWYGYQLSHSHTLILGHTPLPPEHLSDPPSTWRLLSSQLLKYLPIGVGIVGVHLGTVDPIPPLDKLVSSIQRPDTLSLPSHTLLLSRLAPPLPSLSFLRLELATGGLTPVTSLSYQPPSALSELLDPFLVKLEIRHELRCQISQDSFLQDLTSQLEQLKEELSDEATPPGLLSVKTKTKDTSLPLPPPKSKKSPRVPLLRESLPQRSEPYPLTLTPACLAGASDYSLPLHYHIWLPSDLPLSLLLLSLREGMHRYISAITDTLLLPSLPPCTLEISLIPHPLLYFLPIALPHPHTHLLTHSPIDALAHPQTRQHLHTLLSLPPDLPYLFPHRAFPAPRLHLPCPHLSISRPLPPCYNLVQTVPGLYDYYHYMSGGVDDSGWGCAYRSLQTIFSWYLLQGYVKGRDTPPSHREIQESLVHLGDKPSWLVGSKDWIGSVEIGMVLQDMLGVDYKIVPLSSAAELPDSSRQLLHHFEKVGTPVMIGGGQLAHTLLGCAYDESMGTCQLLVLDPHYTGPDDLKTVLKGAWCAWRDVKFWKPNTFYNLCLPLRKSIL